MNTLRDKLSDYDKMKSEMYAAFEACKGQGKFAQYQFTQELEGSIFDQRYFALQPLYRAALTGVADTLKDMLEPYVKGVQ